MGILSRVKMLYKLILVIIASNHGSMACEACQGSGQGCVEANLEEIIPEDLIDSQQQFDSNIEYRIEYEDDTNSFFSKNWIDCQEIIEENEKEADILLIDQDRNLKCIYAFDSTNPNITLLTKRTDSVRLFNLKNTPIVDASVLICDKKSKKSLFTFKTLDGEIIKIGSEKIEQKNYENCERYNINGPN